jgi:uncharacterized protein (TIGR00290 family)
MRRKAAMMWSGGKDSSLALYKTLQEDKYEVCYLVSTFSMETKRLSMHGISEELIELQAKYIGIPLIKMYTNQASHEAYEKAMKKQLIELQEEGVFTMVFGDIFLEDLRKYREEKLAIVGSKAYFPLWKRNTKSLVHEFIKLGFKTICCCVNLSKIKKSQLGRIIDKNWVSELNKDVDPCGENGEFHTLCIDGPIFDKPLRVDCKSVIHKEYNHDGQVFQYGFVDIQLNEWLKNV